MAVRVVCASVCMCVGGGGSNEVDPLNRAPKVVGALKGDGTACLRAGSWENTKGKIRKLK